jgi:uncharacterized coiled-coil protein SlyX
MSPQEVTIGRLRKRVAKLTEQRNHWQKEYTALRFILDKFPFIERRHKSIMDAREESNRVCGLEQRVKEQATLIERLTKEASADR